MPRSDRDTVIVSGVRTAIGKFGGSLKDLRAYQLGAHVMNSAIERAGIEKGSIDEIIAGDCIQCADEANTARTAALYAGIPVEVPSYTVQKQCSSSMQALSSARLQIAAGEADTLLVLGVESMSSGYYYLPSARWGQRLQDGRMVDSIWELLHSGSGLVGDRMIMGQTAENLADMYSITRREQDEVAVRSHNNAENATRTGRFKDEIIPVVMKGKKGDVVFDADEHTRPQATLEDLGTLKPTFKKDGTVTAGNASGLNDGAAAAVVMSRARAKELGLTPLATVRAQASAGCDPKIMGYGPVPAVKKLLPKTGLTVADIGLWEVNEAFAAQYIACERGLGLDREKVNVNGSGIGLGHPVGCTGLRIVLSLAYEMKKRNLNLGVATLCVGGGMGFATLIEIE